MALNRPLGSTDPGWEHGVAQDEKKKKVKCNYCDKIVSGGIYRLKQHLARISGEVTYCKNAPEDVYNKMKENLEGCRTGRRQCQQEDEGHFCFDLFIHNEEKCEEDSSGDRLKEMQEGLPLRSLGFVDPGWEHGVAQDERKKKVKCNYCDKVVSGGINRFKQHLARIPGEVACCKMAPEEVYLKMKENMKWHQSGRKRKADTKENSSLLINLDNEYDAKNIPVNGKTMDMQGRCDKNTSTWSSSGRRKPKRMSLGIGTDAPELQDNLNAFLVEPEKCCSASVSKLPKKMANENSSYNDVISSICKFLYHAGVSAVAANSVYFKKMIDVVSKYGQGLNLPSSQLIFGRYLQEEVANVRRSLVEFRTSWLATGCTIVADSWKDLQGKTMINFLASCPRGLYFVTSVDASEIVEDAQNLNKILDRVIEEVGEENVVQVVTENSLGLEPAGKKLEEKRKSLFWTPCSVHKINAVLEDIVKIKWVGECVMKGQHITSFIYNRGWLLNLMKKEFTGGKELLRPAITRCASSFLTLQSLLEHRIPLKRMFQSEKWASSQISKSEAAKEMVKPIFNSTFWKKVQHLKKSVGPILQVLMKVDNEKGLAMPIVYHAMYRAKFAIKENFGNDTKKYGPYWSIIDNHWNSLFHHPIYAASYFLNPAYHYRSDFLGFPEIMRGLNECIVRLEPDNGKRIRASMQISDFVSAKADFGTELAITTRTGLDPAAWWQQHGINCLELQRIAVRILSQRSSSLGCEHGWSVFDQIHSSRHNSLNQKSYSELRYVHYNLRLREEQLRGNELFCADSPFLERLLGDWIIESEQLALQEHEDFQYVSCRQVEPYDNETNDNDNLCLDGSQVPTDATTLPNVVEPLETLPAIIDGCTPEDSDGDLDFLDENLTG